MITLVFFSPRRIFVSDALTLGYDNLFFPCAILSMGVTMALVWFVAELAINGGRKKMVGKGERGSRRRKKRRVTSQELIMTESVASMFWYT